ncbi:gamma-glutamyl hydrolase 1-like [Dioscorea cayenensis subsp. rotundata]|uniref:folate gamma-glutamyl hydrolase n=1 Tax=Dioscorea cayennensis subsp. rotundata TaxID=55577 RepID=A0AB40CK43_DIOCR|nr:gamma-glutamyl hydrolase 1-like [Dioscorea cayenensis subsp. rotundata]
MTTSNITHFLPFLLLFAVLAVWINGSCAKVPDEDDHAAFLGAPICPSPDNSLYYRPVIGILTHPTDGAGGKLNKTSYIPASYVKFVESGGARVIPIIYDEHEDTITHKLELVNGVLFTGGFMTLPSYTNVAKKIFQTVLHKNEAGNHFPLYGMALGFEQLIHFVGKNPNIMEKIAAYDQASKLNFYTRDLGGTVFQSFPPELLNKMSTKCLAMHNSGVGISRERFEKNSTHLPSFFKVLTTSVDAKNKEFVSTAQAYNYPIVGFQWVPPKNAFEWGNRKIPRTEDAIRVTQQTANYFISEARKSKTKPDETEVLAHLIYNYQPVYTGKEGKGYDQVYFFP